MQSMLIIGDQSSYLFHIAEFQSLLYVSEF